MKFNQGKIKVFILYLFDLFLWVLFSPLILCILLPLGVYKSLVRFLIYLFRKDLSFVTTVDSLVVRTAVKRETICDIGSIMKVEGSLMIQELKDRFNQAVKPNTDVKPCNPLYRLHCRFTTFCGYLCIQAVEVDVEQQIYEEACPEEFSEKDFFSTWFGRPYKNNDLPRWEMVLLVNKKEGCSYLGFRASHGLMDAAGLNIVRDLLCGSNTPLPGTLPKGTGSTFVGKMKLWFILPREVIRFFLTTASVDSVTPAELKNQNYAVSWASIELKRILAIRRKLGISFGPLLYSIQAEALLIYMKERSRNAKLRKSIPVLHTIPRDVPYHEGLRNHFSVVRLDLPYADSLASSERAVKVDNIYQEFLKKEWHTLGLEYVTMVANLFPLMLHPFNTKNRMSMYRLHLANMKLSSEPYYILGKKMENIFTVTTLSSVCPDAVLLTDCTSRGDTIDIAHIGSSRVFKTRNDFEFFANECFLKAVAALES